MIAYDSFPVARPLWRAESTHVRDRLPWLAVAPFLAAVVALPLLRPSGPGNSSPLVDAAMVLSIWTAFLWALRTRTSLRFPYVIGGAMLMLGGAIGAMAGPLPSGGLLDISQDVLLLAWCATVVNLARSPRVLSLLLRTWALSAVAWAALLIGSFVTGHSELSGVTERLGARASLTFGDPNMAGSYFFLALCVISAARFPRRPALRIGAYAVLLAALFLTGSNGAMLSVVLGCTVVTVLRLGHRFGAPAVVASGCVVAVAAFVVFVSPAVSNIRAAAQGSGNPVLESSLGRDTSLSQRKILLQEAYNLYQGAGPWGRGPRTTKPLLIDTLAPYAKEAHDDYVESLIERGVIGAVGLLLLIGSVGVRTWKIARGSLSRDFAAVLPNTAPLIAAVLAIAVNASFYQVQHFRHVWTLLAIVAAVHLWGLSPRSGAVRVCTPTASATPSLP